MTDPTLIASATVIVVASLTTAAVTVINAITKAKIEMLVVAQKNAAEAKTAVAAVEKQVDGNLSEVKAQLANANQRIELLTERLLTTIPTTIVATSKTED